LVQNYEAESEQVYEEGRSILGSLITRLLAVVHMLIDHVVKVGKQFISWAGEHPLALTLAVANIVIWVS
jgi:hypothetical protein